MTTKFVKRFILVVSIILLAGVMIFPEWKYQRASSKYKIGMSLDEALKKIDGKYEISKSGVVPVLGVLTEEQKTTFSFYDVIGESEGIYLEFNCYKRLISIRRLGHPLLRAFEKVNFHPK